MPSIVHLGGNRGDAWLESGQRHPLGARLYLTADRTAAVPEGHLDARFLLGTANDTIPVEQARMLGLLDDAPPDANNDIEPLAGMTIRELRVAADERNIDHRGRNKADLLAALEAAGDNSTPIEGDH